MQTNEVFEKLAGACATVLKSQGGSTVETKKMTADEFADYAMDQIKKAEGEKSTPTIATARIRALNTSIAVAKSAFSSAGLDSFEIPVFKNSDIAMSDIDARFKGIESQVKSLADSIGKGKAFPPEGDDKDKDKEDDKDAKKAKGKGEEDDKDAEKKKAEGKADDDKDKDAKKADDKDDDKDDAEKKKADDKDDDKDDAEKAEWPMDLAKSEGRTDSEKDLYDWGSDASA